jgi:hypothetical protein
MAARGFVYAVHFRSRIQFVDLYSYYARSAKYDNQGACVLSGRCRAANYAHWLIKAPKEELVFV